MKRNYSKAQLAALRKIEPGNTTENEIRTLTLKTLCLRGLVQEVGRGYLQLTQTGLDILHPPSMLIIPDTSHLPGMWDVVIGHNGGIRGTCTLYNINYRFGYVWNNGVPTVTADHPRGMKRYSRKHIYDLLAIYPGE